MIYGITTEGKHTQQPSRTQERNYGAKQLSCLIYYFELRVQRLSDFTEGRPEGGKAKLGRLKRTKQATRLPLPKRSLTAFAYKSSARVEGGDAQGAPPTLQTFDKVVGRLTL